MKKVLVVVDYQNDFVNGALGFPDSEAVSGNIYDLVNKRENENNLIVFTKDTHGKDYLSTREGIFLPTEHCIKGTEGHRLYGGLAKYEKSNKSNVVIIEKDTFGSEDLCAKIENDLGSRPDVIEFCGVVTNICVISNVVLCMTHFKKAEIIVHSQATAALGDMQNHALEVLKGLGVKVL